MRWMYLRQYMGVMPQNSLNALLKWCWLEKPGCWAICSSEKAVLISRLPAYSRRIFVIKCLGVVPMEWLNRLRSVRGPIRNESVSACTVTVLRLLRM